MESKALGNCGNCVDKLPKTGDCALCTACDKAFHFETCSVKKQTWIAMGVAKQSTWTCSKCRKLKKGSTSNVEDEEVTGLTSRAPYPDDEYEASSLGVQRTILAKVNALMEMKGQLNNIETSMKFLAEKYDSLLAEVVELRAENKTLKEEVDLLKMKDKYVKEASDKLASEVADLDQYGRRLNLEIHGLKVEGNPKEENLTKVLQKVARNIKVQFDPSEIHQAHRLQPRTDGKPPTVIVQFYSKTTRDQWMHNGKIAKLNRVYFNENLCMHYRTLLKEAKLRAKTHNYRYVWFKGGRVLVKKEENGDVLIIKTMDDLKKIR